MWDQADFLIAEEDKNSLETLQTKLNFFLVDFISERFQNPKSQEKKEIFFWEFNKLSLEEKREYRNFVRDAIIDMSQEIFLSEDSQYSSFGMQEILSQMPKMKKYEIYAGILNNC